MALGLAGMLALSLHACRLERVEDLQGRSAPDADAQAGIAEPLAWSRDVAVIAAVEPPNQLGAMHLAVRQLSRDLCERLTLQGDADAAWHAAVMLLEHELSSRGYTATEALLSSSDGRWGAGVLAATSRGNARLPHSRLMETAWHYWERGSGLQLWPEVTITPPATVAAPAAVPIAPVEPNTAPAAGPPAIEDPSRNWVQTLPVASEQPPEPPARVALEPLAQVQGSGELDLDAGAEETTRGLEAAHQPSDVQSDVRSNDQPDEPGEDTQHAQPDNVRVALLVRLSDGSFRGTWLSAVTDPASGETVVRDAVIGERLFVGALGAVFALDATGQFQEPRAASRAYERLLQPGTGKAPATVVLTAATLELDKRPGIFAVSSRGAQAGKCRAIQQESAL